MAFGGCFRRPAAEPGATLLGHGVLSVLSIDLGRAGASRRNRFLQTEPTKKKIKSAVAMAWACLPKLQKEILEHLFEDGLDCDEIAGRGGGDAETRDELAAYTRGRGGGAAAGNASLSCPGRPGACTSRSPCIVE